MRKIIAIVALLGLALPASAADCSTGNINWIGTSAQLERIHDAADIRYDIVGDFLVYGEASAFIPDEATGVTVCADGPAFTLAEEPVERTPHPSQLIVDADDETPALRTPEPQDANIY